MKPNKIKKDFSQKVYFSSTETAEAWNGGGFYQLMWKFKIGKWMLCIWKLPKMIDL